jgi:polar amino acid transport system substrate-binding protein
MHARFLIFIIVLGSTLLAQEPERALKTDSVLKIGIKHAPPFVTLRDGFTPEGMSIEFWNQLHESLGQSYEFVIYDDLSELSHALDKGEIDLSINPVTVTEERMKRFDFSQPYFISGTAVALAEPNLLVTMLALIFSWEFFSAVGSMVVVIGLVGLMMWLIERRSNRGMFHPGVHGLGDGMWWSAVTMTTVGYGDKVPRTKTGRVFGFFWMFVAIVLVSGLTAFITSSLTNATADDDLNSLEDLKKFKVATVAGSSTSDYLRIFDIPYQDYKNVDQALDALNDQNVEMVVYDRPILSFYLRGGNYRNLALSKNNLKTDYYSFTYPKGSNLKNKYDPLIVKVLRSNTWNLKLKVVE